ncbi:MAG: hypothetical protein SPH93_13215 [Clostridium sp.]|uniref:hypothetical protein n=1 Tax=Clostridium sp. TaxID=1506 RepID=UPI002A913DF4|nr:hypothetical protein [Clostridium sp.]MDY6228595.1 hypothetical protein [Clostridium sp.]
MNMNYSGHTKADNTILFDNSISSQARILYFQFKHFSTIPNFVIRKSTMIKVSGLKGNTFDKYLKELKDLGLIFVNRIRVGNKYEYYYTLEEQIQEYPKVEDKKNKITTESLDSSQSIIIEEAGIKLTDKQKKVCKHMNVIVLKRVLNSYKIKNATGLIEIYTSNHWRDLGEAPNDNILRYIGKNKNEFMNPADSSGCQPIEGQIHIDFYEDETEEMRVIRMKALGIAI